MKAHCGKVDFSIIQEAFEQIICHPIYGAKLQNKWLSTTTFIDAMKEAQYFSGEHAAMLKPKWFNHAMARSKKWGTAMCCYDGSNKTNLWRVTYRHAQVYMVCDEQVQYPANVNLAWYQEVCNQTGILRCTRSMTEAGLLHQDNVDGVGISEQLLHMEGVSATLRGLSG